MSHNARVLQFPGPRGGVCLSAREAEVSAKRLLSVSLEERTAEQQQRCFSTPEILLSICALLRENWDIAPTMVELEAAAIYRWISDPSCVVGLFDERDYFLGETALLAGVACRHLGKREEAFLWLDRAEAGFRHTMNPAPGLANVAYARLALRFEMGRYQDVFELLPSLEVSFTKLRMGLERAKCRLLLAMTCKQVGENGKAIELLDGLRRDVTLAGDAVLRARVLTELGDLLQLDGQVEKALLSFKEALTLLQGRQLSLAQADLKLYLGAAYRAQGSLEEARDVFRAAQRDYTALAMRPLAAYTHLLVAETLIEMKREREAEWEILAALPTIDELGMVPEGFAAVALLRESVKRRRTDLSALQQLQSHLQALG